MSNLVIVFNSMALFPLLLYVFIQNLLYVLSVEVVVVTGIMDLALTIDGINRGYKEGNWYRLYLKTFGDKWGLRVTAFVNFAIRGAIIYTLTVYVQPYTSLAILIFGLVTLVGPFWNILTMRSFRDDIVAEFPTEVNADSKVLQIDSGEKRRLEQRKEAESV